MFLLDKKIATASIPTTQMTSYIYINRRNTIKHTAIIKLIASEKIKVDFNLYYCYFTNCSFPGVFEHSKENLSADKQENYILFVICHFRWLYTLSLRQFCWSHYFLFESVYSSSRPTEHADFAVAVSSRYVSLYAVPLLWTCLETWITNVWDVVNNF